MRVQHSTNQIGKISNFNSLHVPHFIGRRLLVVYMPLFRWNDPQLKVFHACSIGFMQNMHRKTVRWNLTVCVFKLAPIDYYKTSWDSKLQGCNKCPISYRKNCGGKMLLHWKYRACYTKNLVCVLHCEMRYAAAVAAGR